ncbi:Tetratricopeptide repeat protein 9A [Trichoplax sp. H2]|nr:Tetratricopeptide repeat protein 9A [Trichoplax sp. H2]|eukprot:RDD47487.1 Tetratricopeptide repeat protein 9A [Trichoplax sp. H2]
MDKIKLANDHKDTGNDAFKNGDFTSAIRSYHHALLCVKGILSKSTMKELGMLVGDNAAQHRANSKEEQIKEEAQSIKLSLHNNLAVCLIKQNKWERAISHCDEALMLESNNCKAIYRRGLAYLEIGNIDKAGKDLRKASALQPHDHNIQKALSRLGNKEKVGEQVERRMYAAMFGIKT